MGKRDPLAPSGLSAHTGPTANECGTDTACTIGALVEPADVNQLPCHDTPCDAATNRGKGPEAANAAIRNRTLYDSQGAPRHSHLSGAGDSPRSRLLRGRARIQTVTSARINQYERGAHEPKFQISATLAHALTAPTAFLYSEENDLAEAILALAVTCTERREKLLASKGKSEAD